MFDAVIFDWDGTLADTKDVVLISFQRVLKEIGCDVSDEFLNRMIGIGARNMFIKAMKSKNMLFDSTTIDELMKRKTKIQIELTKKINLFKGTTDLLSSLHHKVKMALATMSNRKVIEKILKEKKIINYFDIIITADEVLQPKPNPEIFLECANKLRCKPERCVVLEDSIFGVKAAKEAGMKCVAIPTGAYSIEELERENPTLIVCSIMEKVKIMDFILSKQTFSSQKSSEKI